MEHQEETKTSQNVFIYFGVFLTVLVVYVLSIGPAALIAKESSSRNLDKIFDIFYMPLKWLYDNVKLFNDFLEWYFKLWVS